jgi:hypothetical protein
LLLCSSYLPLGVPNWTVIYIINTVPHQRGTDEAVPAVGEEHRDGASGARPVSPLRSVPRGDTGEGCRCICGTQVGGEKVSCRRQRRGLALHVAPWRGVNGIAQSRMDPRAYAAPHAPLGAYPGMEREAGATRSDGRNGSASWFCFFLILFTTFFRSCIYFAPRFNTRLVLKHLFLRWMSDQLQRFFLDLGFLFSWRSPLDLVWILCGLSVLILWWNVSNQRWFLFFLTVLTGGC